MEPTWVMSPAWRARHQHFTPALRCPLSTVFGWTTSGGTAPAPVLSRRRRARSPSISPSPRPLTRAFRGTAGCMAKSRMTAAVGSAWCSPGLRGRTESVGAGRPARRGVSYTKRCLRNCSNGPCWLSWRRHPGCRRGSRNRAQAGIGDRGAPSRPPWCGRASTGRGTQHRRGH